MIRDLGAAFDSKDLPRVCRDARGSIRIFSMFGQCFGLRSSDPKLKP